MIYLFYLAAVIGLAYFLVARRCFDFLALAFFSACFYFLPGFVGYAGHPSGRVMEPVPLLASAYVVMIAVFAAILATAVLIDRLRIDDRLLVRTSNTFVFVPSLSTILAIAGCGFALLTIGPDLFGANKFELLTKLNRWFLLWTTAATIGFATAMIKRRYVLACINLFLLLLNLYVGFRLELVVALLTVMTLRLAEHGPQRLYVHWRAGVAVVVLGLAMLLYKYLLTAIKVGDWTLVAEQIRNPDAVRLVFLYSEPMVIQGILNEIFLQDYHADLAHFASCMYLLVPFAPLFGAEITGFDVLFQPTLFSSVTEYGLGNNVWGEMIASGGWILFVSFLLFYCTVLSVGKLILRKRSGETIAIGYVALMYWAFYIHRNDLLFQLTLTRRVLLAGACVAAMSVVLALAASHRVTHSESIPRS